MTSDSQPPIWRQHVMRVLFLLNLISLGPDNWSVVIFPDSAVDPMTGVVISFYAALAFLCLFAIRFPLQFTPLLLMQLFYKSAWLIGVYRPAYAAGNVDENLESWCWIMAVGVAIDLLVIPWGYVYRAYLKRFFQFRTGTAT